MPSKPMQAAPAMYGGTHEPAYGALTRTLGPNGSVRLRFIAPVGRSRIQSGRISSARRKEQGSGSATLLVMPRVAIRGYLDEWGCRVESYPKLFMS
jgi:hypothetical protein